MPASLTDVSDAARSSVSARVDVALGERAYPIWIGRGLLAEPDRWAALARDQVAVVVTDANVGSHWAEVVRSALVATSRDVRVVTVAPGEGSKAWPTLARVCDELAAAGCDRQSVLFALGGGVVGDLAGFAAACYMRGIRFVQLPTSLLAQIDSSVGGKTGLNIDAGKNLVGAFHQPSAVVIDLATLDTLPRREFVSGFAEILKHGWVADAAYLAWLETHAEALLGRAPDLLAEAIAWSCRIKADVVAGDERESGRRAILNFGHTFGHAIESVAGYGALLHGEAVAIGMLMAMHLSAALGGIQPSEVARTRALLERYGLPTRLEGCTRDDLMAVFRSDKKAAGGVPRFVVLTAIGSAALRTAPQALVAAAIDAVLAPPGPA